MTQGPLSSLKVVELAGMGPTPFCGMLLGDLGADIIRVDRLEAIDVGIDFPARFDLRNRNKRSVAIDLKSKEGIALLFELIDQADVLVEGYRPGVTDKLGFGPDACLARNPRLVYARCTGWGQTGPMAQAVGHDINYISLNGALSMIGPADGPPVIPLNFLGDYGGGGIYAAFGVVSAVLEARQTGKGQVVDAAMLDGVTSILTVHHAMRQMGTMNPERSSNVLDGGAHYYNCYETSDGKYMAVGAIEARFYAELLAGLGLKDEKLPAQNDRSAWPELKRRFAEIFRTKSRDEWSAIFEGTNSCVSPVLDLAEAHLHPHNVARQSLIEVDGVLQPPPTPRFSRTPGEVRHSAPRPGDRGASALSDWNIDKAVIDAANAAKAMRVAD